MKVERGGGRLFTHWESIEFSHSKNGNFDNTVFTNYRFHFKISTIQINRDKTTKLF